MRRAFAVVLTGSFGIGCASQMSTVTEADMGRLSGDQLAPVQAAQQEEQRAEQSRNEVLHRLEQAQGDLGQARPTVDEAKAQVAQASAARDQARKGGDPQVIANAEAKLAEVQNLQRVREASVSYREKVVDARETELQIANARIALNKAKVEQSELTALQQAHDPAANKYDEAAIDQRVTDRASELQGAQRRSAKGDSEVREAMQHWQAVSASAGPTLPADAAPPPIVPQGASNPP